jgi:hypothetical protein
MIMGYGIMAQKVYLSSLLFTTLNMAGQVKSTDQLSLYFA